LGAEPALQRLLRRGGFPEPCPAETDVDADRWRAQYVTGLVREDVLDFSRVHEVRALRQPAQHGRVAVAGLAGWLARLAA
jgi:predicted AAA+ superfamily ATPase